MWLSLFKAKTEEDFRKLEELEVPFVEQTLEAYRSITATDEFKELERLRTLARHNEAAALEYARSQEREKWQGIVAEKDTALEEKDAALEEKDKLLAKQKAEIAALMAKLNEKK